MSYSSIVFNEGEPLDPNKLNQLQTNLADIYKTSNLLYNATVNEQGSATVPIVYFGTATTPPLTANKAQIVSLSLPSSFDPSKETFAIASVNQAIGSDIVAIYTKKVNDKYEAWVVSNTTRPAIQISYLMVQQKSV